MKTGIMINVFLGISILWLVGPKPLHPFNIERKTNETSIGGGRRVGG